MMNRRWIRRAGSHTRLHFIVQNSGRQRSADRPEPQTGVGLFSGPGTSRRSCAPARVARCRPTPFLLPRSSPCLLDCRPSRRAVCNAVLSILLRPLLLKPFGLSCLERRSSEEAPSENRIAGTQPRSISPDDSPTRRPEHANGGGAGTSVANITDNDAAQRGRSPKPFAPFRRQLTRPRSGLHE